MQTGVLQVYFIVRESTAVEADMEMSQKRGIDVRAAFVYWLMTLSYMGLIFYLSSRNDIDIPKLTTNFDKILHAGAYMVMAFLLYLSINKSGIRNNIFTAAFLCAVLYGMTDEIHQYFVPGRDASVGDLIADAIGALIGCFGAHYLKW